MTTYLLAGGGTAGHVNPLLAVADRIRDTEPAARVVVLGTAEGLEARLVPARGYELVTIPKLPFPRRPNAQALSFPGRLRRAAASVAGLVRERGVDIVVGFGGYASAPAYLAARRAGVPLVLHEANAKPGLANRLGARRAAGVGVAFAGTPLPRATVVGMPLRHEIETLDRPARRGEALARFSLAASVPTLLVTGGSLGARRINRTVHEAARRITGAGWQVLHIQGDREGLDDPHIEGYRLLDYCDRMDLAFAACDLALSRAGAATVCELAALGIPAVYVPYPVGNGEQRFNAKGVVAAGGGVLVEDSALDAAWVEGVLLPMLADRAGIARMGERAASVGMRDGTERMVSLIHSAL
ncbi:UDP-N-acetylglucosamine--N-acetylmuramyl-(pentapeptide) pyrophosphoryl-undecaprenol N-acetylglucosamine transferase [Microbacterium sp. STN6]|uniref:UDP-N-acetylglucosamine--N-acetylmuramyl- (pentapeptide) pyrophosphoryl-undecaprenol N-acetylglucosamine transferase n=1 Tax=Microbacterium sp. STN6 TaxID=2995588 RepID=UPI002260F05A|nr:UDP-N-acetylglucosamine--N-acetylmuramyl-(pentapeptide) pyrophosphoryl-undecaprenol N-acetylglucosamine transferase [Microbacterium sp. STN6]MCX7521511.1 UDP-N-acetylglucosamine--N-acetylmuramyl-(pentapeptide) pyrophosphoryl-undecaprenol N-acetylglucosamine transferase [Microbacterium sp. STN6]